MTQTPPISAEKVEAARRIFEVFCGGPVDWSKHSMDDADDSIFHSADWLQAMSYATAALNAVAFRPCTCHPDGRPEPCPHKYALSDCLAAASIPASRGVETEREEPEERFKDLIGHYESVEDLAIGMRMSARYFREKEPSDAVPQPRIMADFHDRVAVALERAASPAPQLVQEQEPVVGATYYDEGKDADWFEALSDTEFANRAAYAGMDIADGDFENVENCLPVVAILTGAADRIRRLLRSEAQAVGNEDTIIARAEAAEAKVERLTEALRNIAEGNLGDDPWQANYDRIRAVAAAALGDTP